MALSSPKLHLLFFAALFLMLANNGCSFTHNSFNPKPDDLIYQGDAHVQSGSTVLHLTKTNSSGYPQPNSVGRVIYSPPIHLWDCHVEEGYSRQVSFETNIDFTITPVDNIDPADGLTFFIVPVGTPIPPCSAGENFGIFGPSGNASSTFAVEFDTYVNRGDPPYRHIGINVNSTNSINTTNFNSATGQLVHARIDYEATTRRLTVVATVGSQQVSLRNVVVNLESILPEYVQVGISASTGFLVQRHDVSAWEFTSTLDRENSVNPKCLLQKKDDAHIVQYV